MGSVLFEYDCPNKCKEDGDINSLRVNEDESDDKQLILECCMCGIELVFIRKSGVFHKITTRKKIKGIK